MKESKFNIKVKFNNKDYIYNSRNNGIIELSNEDLNIKENIDYLLQEKYYVEDNMDEIENLEHEVNHNIFSKSDELTLTISLTQQCNFSCVYCYQEREPKVLDKKNSYEIIKIVKEIISEKNIKSLKIHYFGGEPLLNIDILYLLDEEFKKISNIYNIKYNSYITTNGELLTEKLLSKIKFKSVQLSFDGLEDNHNKLRKSIKFKFNDTINLMYSVLKYCEKIDLRYNLCEDNKEDLIPFIDLIMSRFDYRRLNFHIARTIKFNETDNFSMISFEEYCELNLKARFKLQEYGKNLILPTRIEYPCPFTHRNALSISPDLSLSLCEGNSSILKEKFSSKCMKNKAPYKVEEQCLECKILPLCLGGCSANKEFRTSCMPEKNIIEQLIINQIKIESRDNLINEK